MQTFSWYGALWIALKNEQRILDQAQEEEAWASFQANRHETPPPRISPAVSKGWSQRYLDVLVDVELGT